MDIDIDIGKLSAETRDLLLRFQIAYHHYLFYDQFSDMPVEQKWLEEFLYVKRRLKYCREEQIIDVGRKLDINTDKVCQDLDAEGERLVAAGELNPDDYQSWFNTKLTERLDEMTELENALSRLSLRVADKRSPFFQQVN